MGEDFARIVAEFVARIAADRALSPAARAGFASRALDHARQVLDGIGEHAAARLLTAQVKDILTNAGQL